MDPMNANETVYDNPSDVNGNYPYGTLAFYMCVPGFGLLGSGTRVCGGDGSSTAGSFDGSAPSCVGEYSVDVNSLKGVPCVSQLLIDCPH